MVGKKFEAWGHKVRSHWTQLLKGMNLLASLVLGIIVIELIAKFVVFDVLV